MANINRTIQIKRNQIFSLNANEAKQRIISIEPSLKNGELVTNTYMDDNARNGFANVLAIKAQDKLFFIDNQVILNKLGINDDGTVNENVTNSVEKFIERIVNAAGLKSDGTYLADSTDNFISGATSLANADRLLSGEIKEIEDFIGMSEGASGKSITDVEDTATIDFTKEEASDGTKKIKADVKISAENGNIINSKGDGIYANVDYNPVTNAIVINGAEKPLNAGSIVDSIEYDSATEELVIKYHASSSSEEKTIRASLKDLIEEFDFIARDDSHNVGFTITRNVNGKTTVQADVQNFDCGEY
jgi:hypothetical protein